MQEQLEPTLRKVVKKKMSVAHQRTSEFFAHFTERNLLGLSASIGFYLVLSLTPFLLLLFALTAVIGWENSSEFRSAVAENLGPSAAIGLDAISHQLDADKGGGISFGILGLVAILFSSSGVVGEIRDALNRVMLPLGKGQDAALASAAAAEKLTTWQSIKGWALARLFAILAVVTCVVVAIVSFGASVVLKWILPVDENFWSDMKLLLSLAVFAVLFYAMFRLLPSRQPRSGFALSAALICVGLFHVGNKMLEVYFANSVFSNSYGALAGFIVLLLWAQYNGLIILISAVAAQVFFTQKNPVLDQVRAGKTELPGPGRLKDEALIH